MYKTHEWQIATCLKKRSHIAYIKVCGSFLNESPKTKHIFKEYIFYYN